MDVYLGPKIDELSMAAIRNHKMDFFCRKLHDMLLQSCWLVVKSMIHVRISVKVWNLALISSLSQKDRFSLFIFLQKKVGRASLKIRKFS